MDQSLLEKLYSRYPNLYRTKPALACGNGWFHLIDKYSNKLEALVTKLEDPFREGSYLTYAKEKYGELSIFLHGGTPEMYTVVEELEAASAHICEVCGSQGKLRPDRGWILTLCDTHDAEDRPHSGTS